MKTATHHTAPRTFDIKADWRALHRRTDALLVTEAGDEPILESLYDEDGNLVVTTATGDHVYSDTVTVRMPATTFAAIRAAAARG